MALHSLLTGHPAPSARHDADRAPAAVGIACSLLIWHLKPYCTQAQSLMKLLHDFYTEPTKYGFVHAFNHAQSEFDFKRMLDMLGHDTSALPR